MYKSGLSTDKTLFPSPFSRAYWVQAASEFKNTRMLLFAALMIALRVALKPLSIPIAADLRINTAFFINAFGAATFGPVVAVPAAAISDFLGCMLFPQGVYYPPFMLTEIAGSVIFALFLYRARITPLRVILSRFCICFFVNILLQTPIMRWYYAFIGSSALYPLLDTVCIAKNLVLFPVEAALLMLFLRAAVPPVQRQGYVASTVDRLVFTRRHVLALIALLLLGAGATAGYAVYDYNTKSFSASYTAAERLSKNRLMNAWAAEQLPDEREENLVTVIQSARSQVLNPEMTYELIVYRVDEARFREKAEENEAYTRDTLLGYSKSKAKADDALIPLASGTAIMNKHSGERISISLTALDAPREGAK